MIANVSKRKSHDNQTILKRNRNRHQVKFMFSCQIYAIMYTEDNTDNILVNSRCTCSRAEQVRAVEFIFLPKPLSDDAYISAASQYAGSWIRAGFKTAQLFV